MACFQCTSHRGRLLSDWTAAHINTFSNVQLLQHLCQWSFFFFSRVHFNTNPMHLKYYRTFTQLYCIFHIKAFEVIGDGSSSSSSCCCCRSLHCMVHYPVTRRENPGWVQCPQLLRRRALPTEQREAAMLEVVAWCISNWLCTIPPPCNPSPSSPLPTGVLSGCVYLSVCYVPAFKCTVSISTFSQRGLFCFLFFARVMWLAAFLLSFSQSLLWPWARRGPAQSGPLWLL